MLICKNMIKTKGLFYLTVLVVLTAVFFGEAAAQKVRLRSQINPACAVSSNTKFADIYADGNIAVQGSYSCRGVFIYDISNPDAPVLSSWYNPSPTLQFLEAIVIGNRGYFGSGSGDGVHIVDLTNPASPTLLGKVNTSNGGFNTIHEMMVFDHGGARYLLENSNSTSNRNLKIINVTNPAVPVMKWDFLSSDGGWVHAMHIRGNKMYLSGFVTSNRIDIYDIANLGTQAPVRLGSVEVGGNSNHSAWTNETGEYLYSARELSNGDLRVFDVRNPAVPLLVRTLKAADLGLNAVAPHNPVVFGNYLYVAWYQAGVQVFDITNPANPKRIGQYDTYPNAFAPPPEELRAAENAEPWDMICGSDFQRNILPNTYDGNWAVFPQTGSDKVLAGDMRNGLLVLDASQVALPNKNIISDFDGDRKTDFSVFTPATGQWITENSSDGGTSAVNWGLPGDIIAAGDYDGDGKSDRAVWRPSNGTWYVVYSSGYLGETRFGLTGDVPAAADYDADGKTDFAVWRPSNGTWYIVQSTLGYRQQQWGLNGDKVLTGDYEGDGKADLAVWRPSNGTWYILRSSSNIAIIQSWGLNGDKPLFADFDGDGQTELTVYRPSEANWYIFNSETNAITIYPFGFADDIPVPADYDGDGKADIAVYRPGTNVWYRVGSIGVTYHERQFGSAGDKASPSSVQPQ